MTGSTRLGRYRLVSRVAVGGTAEVFVAVAEGIEGFEKRVVVKRLLPQLARDPEIRAMFLDEARLQARLQHRHVVEVYDVGHEEGAYFFAAERVPGRDLREVLSVCPGTPLPLGVALHILIAVADGLNHAHDATADDGSALGLVHRDISPSNVLVGWNGDVKLTDFGVAKWAAQRSHTRQGILKGKCAYMSPEQCRAETLDRRSDVWALGILLFEISTGRRPFSDDSDFEVMRAIVDGRFAKPSELLAAYPTSLEAIVCKALSARRDDRFTTAALFSAALRDFAAGMDIGPNATEALLKDLFADSFGKDEVSDETAPAAAGRTATDITSAQPRHSGSANKRYLRAFVGIIVATAALTTGLVIYGRSESPPPAQMKAVALAKDAGLKIAIRLDALGHTGHDDAAPDRPRKDASLHALRPQSKKPRTAAAPPPLWDLDSPEPP